MADLTYEPVPLHFKIPHGLWLHEATSVAVDSHDEVYVFNRGNMPVMVFDADGNLIRYWGNETPYEGTTQYTDPYGNQSSRYIGTEYIRPHAITIDHEDNVWLVDDLANAITKCDRNGNRILMLCPGGVVLRDAEKMKQAMGKTQPAPEKQSGDMFNRPTDICVHPVTGDLFITDGYGNSRVHHLKADGTHVKSWGESGTDAGQFNIPHNICLAADNNSVIVADRENSRVQHFTLDGKYIDQWHIHRAVSVALDKKTECIIIAEQGTSSSVQTGRGFQISELDSWTPNLGHRVGWYTPDGTRVNQIGAATPGERPHQFNWLHGVAVNSKGDVYAAEVSYCECGRLQKPYPRELVSLRKWRKTNKRKVTE